MQRESFDFDWSFGTGKFWFMGFRFNGELIKVDLPHDFTISTNPDPHCVSGASTGYFNGDLGCYVKRFDVPAQWEGQHIELELDGAYMKSEVSVNGNIVGARPYGYSPYSVDLSAQLRYGASNEVRIVVDNSAMPNSRWYTGSGIYRHVDLLRGPALHIATWGVFARTQSIVNGTAYLVVEASVENSSSEDREALVQVKLLDGSAGVAVSPVTSVVVPASGKYTAKLQLEVPAAKLWDLDNPYLYTVKCELLENEKQTDSCSTFFGIRTISMDSQMGFRLNNKTIKLKGGCVHHDSGILGAAAFDAAEYRKIRLHKENGYNAVRCAHNPPSRGLLEACDRLGILVINEAFDMWRAAKNAQDYHLFFEDWWKRDLEAMVLRDRNHPSVILWSIGNELEERSGMHGGNQLSYELASFIKGLDDSRFVTAALCGVFPTMWEKEEQLKNSDGNAGGAIQDFENKDFISEHFLPRTEEFCKPLDVVGYNYLPYLYGKSGEAYPGRVICGTESYPMEMAEVWASVEKYPFVIGDFTWTSHDYIGEAGGGKVCYSKEPPNGDMGFAFYSPYPWRTAYNSDFDLCGFDRPRLHYRKIVWGSEETYIAVKNPEHYGEYELISHWGWPQVLNKWTWNGYEGKQIAIEVYSGADEVELYVNGISLGTKPAGRENRYKACFETVYSAGKIEAVSRTKGKEISRDVVSTVGEPAAIRLSPEKARMEADGQDLCYVTVEIVDKNGTRVQDAEIKLKATVNGQGILASFGSANPKTAENYSIGSFTTFEGRLLAVIRAGHKQGSVVLTVSSEGFENVSTRIAIGSK